jgi:hypothetical protein
MDIAKAAVFIASWTAVTVGAGMREVTKTAQRWRLSGTAAKKRLDVFIRKGLK